MNLLLVVICLGTLMVELPQADDGPPELVPDDDDGPQALLHLPPPDVGPEGCLLLPDSDDGMEILCYPCRVPLPMQCCAKDCRHYLWDCNRDLLSEHKAKLRSVKHSDGNEWLMGFLVGACAPERNVSSSSSDDAVRHKYWIGKGEQCQTLCFDALVHFWVLERNVFARSLLQ